MDCSVGEAKDVVCGRMTFVMLGAVGSCKSGESRRAIWCPFYTGKSHD